MDIKDSKKEKSGRVCLLAKYKPMIKRYLTVRNGLWGFGIIFFLSFYLQIQSVLGTFSFLEGRDSSLLTEIGQIKEAYTKIGNDMNEIRGFLHLPTKTYLGFDELSTSSDEDKNTDQLQLALFKYADHISLQKKLDDNLSRNVPILQELLTNETLAKFIATGGYIVSPLAEDDEMYFMTIAEGENIVLTLQLDKSTGIIEMINDFETKEYNSPTGSTGAFAIEVVAFIESFKEHAVEVAEEEVDEGAVIADKVESAQESLEKTMKDKGFQLLLKQAGLSVGKMREDDVRVYYDIFDGKGVVNMIVMEKATGVVNIVRPDGTNPENVLFFDPEFKKKNSNVAG